MGGDELRQAREFANGIGRVLNRTVCTGVKITAMSGRPGCALVGQDLAKNSPDTKAFPVRIGNRKPRCWLKLGYELSLDQSARFLVVMSSIFCVLAGPDDSSCLCHFDYVRENPSGYPEAHVQVNGVSEHLDLPGEPNTRELGRLHLPVGGRRFRPTLEDVIEFLVVEKLAEPREGWRDVLDEQRCEWEQIQLKAAIRKDPQVAVAVLSERELAA